MGGECGQVANQMGITPERRLSVGRFAEFICVAPSVGFRRLNILWSVEVIGDDGIRRGTRWRWKCTGWYFMEVIILH